MSPPPPAPSNQSYNKISGDGRGRGVVFLISRPTNVTFLLTWSLFHHVLLMASLRSGTSLNWMISSSSDNICTLTIAWNKNARHFRKIHENYSQTKYHSFLTLLHFNKQITKGFECKHFRSIKTSFSEMATSMYLPMYSSLLYKNFKKWN